METAKATNSTLESLEIISVDRLNATVNESFIVCQTVQQRIELNNLSMNGNEANEGLSEFCSCISYISTITEVTKQLTIIMTILYDLCC